MSLKLPKDTPLVYIQETIDKAKQKKAIEKKKLKSSKPKN